MKSFLIGAWLLSPAWVGAFAACASALIALWGFWRQNKSYKESLALDLAMKLDERFNDQVFRTLRSDAAKALLNQNNLTNSEEVFDFFETVGSFQERQSLDDELIHDFFFHWINLYWNAGKTHIEDQRRSHTKMLWQKFEKLYGAVIEIEKRGDVSSKDLNPNPDQIKKWLEEEIE